MMHDARRNPAVTLLNDGKVLVAGGLGPTSPALASAEVYDPAANTWTLTGSMNQAVGNQTMTLLPNNKVLATGGDDIGRTYARSEIWDPGSGIWTTVASLETPRYGHRANLLENGKVLVTGGHNGNDRIGTAELYDPVANRWSSAGSMATATPSAHFDDAQERLRAHHRRDRVDQRCGQPRRGIRTERLDVVGGSEPLDSSRISHRRNAPGRAGPDRGRQQPARVTSRRRRSSIQRLAPGRLVHR